MLDNDPTYRLTVMDGSHSVYDIQIEGDENVQK